MSDTAAYPEAHRELDTEEAKMPADENTKSLKIPAGVMGKWMAGLGIPVCLVTILVGTLMAGSRAEDLAKENKVRIDGIEKGVERIDNKQDQIIKILMEKK